MMDKVRQWTHPREALPDTIIDCDLLPTNATIYWLTGTAGSSAYVGYAQDSSRPPSVRPGTSTSAARP